MVFFRLSFRSTNAEHDAEGQVLEEIVIIPFSTATTFAACLPTRLVSTEAHATIRPGPQGYSLWNSKSLQEKQVLNRVQQQDGVYGSGYSDFHGRPSSSDLWRASNCRTLGEYIISVVG